MREKINQILIKVYKMLPYLILLLVFSFNIMLLVLKGTSLLDSDIASEIVLADFLNKEGGLVSPNWFYSTEIHIFSQQPFLQLGLYIFPNDWNLARTLGIALELIMIVLGYFLLSYSIKEKSRYAAWFAIIVICPFGFWYMHMITVSGFYMAPLLFSMLGVSFIALFIEADDRIKRVIWLILMLMTAFCSGMKSVRYLIFPYAPLLVTAVCLLIYRVQREPEKIKSFHCKEWRFAIGVIASTIFNMIGYLVNSKILCQRYIYQNANSQAWGEMSLAALLGAWSDFLSLFGFQNDEIANSLSVNGRTNPEVFSLQGIASLFGILFSMFIVFSAVRLLLRWSKLSFWQRVVVALFWSTLLIDGIVFKWTKGFDTGAAYWIPVVPFTLMLIQIECSTEDFVLPYTRKAIVLLVVICTLITSYATVDEYENKSLYANEDTVNVANWLVDQGYTEGYATFWNSNVLTALSNGKLEMWTVWNLNDRNIQAWLQKTEHTNPPTAEKVFAVIGPHDDVDMANMYYDDLGMPEVVFSDEYGYTIVGYER